MSSKQPKRSSQTAKDCRLELPSPRKRSRATELTNENLAVLNASLDKTNSNLAINLVQQERAHMAESAKGSMLQEPACENEPTKIDGLSKLHRPDLPTNSSPQEWLCMISPATEPFALHAREGMRLCGVREGSMEDLELRKAACHGMLTDESKRPPGSRQCIEVDVSEAEKDSEDFCDPDEKADGMKLAQNDEVKHPPRPLPRDMRDTLHASNQTRMRKSASSGKGRE